MAYGQAGTTITGSPPACRVYNSVTQSLTNVTEATLTFDTERFDTDSMHSTVTNTGRITFNTAGLYVVAALVNYANNAAGVRYTYIRHNGANYVTADTRAATNGLATIVNVAAVMKVAAGDYAEVRAYQSSGGALNVSASSATDWTSADFMATWIGLGT
jgi:hypothetical protein